MRSRSGHSGGIDAPIAAGGRDLLGQAATGEVAEDVAGEVVDAIRGSTIGARGL